MKINVDASIYKGNSCFAIGIIVRNDYVNFVLGKSMRLTGRVSVIEVEVGSVYEALHWIQEMQYKKVIIECD